MELTGIHIEPFFISLFWTTYRIDMCPINIPSLYENTPSPENSEVYASHPMPHSTTSARLDDTIEAMQAILTNDFNRCSNTPNPSFVLAWKFLMNFSFIVALIVSYIIACVL